MKHPAIIGAVLVAFFAGFPAVSAQDQDQGNTLYEKHCAECHGVTGKGDGPAAKALGSPPTDFRDAKFWRGDVEKRIRTAVENGYGSMPPTDLKAGEIKAISDYMARAFKK